MQKNRQLIKEDKVGKEMILKSTMYQKQNIDLSSAPWTMHEFFAGSGLVAYGLREMFSPVWQMISANRRPPFMRLILGVSGLCWTTSRISGEQLTFRSPLLGQFSLSGFVSGWFYWRNPCVPQWLGLGMATGTGRDGRKNLRFYCWRMWRDCCLQTVATITVFFIWRS